MVLFVTMIILLIVLVIHYVFNIEDYTVISSISILLLYLNIKSIVILCVSHGEGKEFQSKYEVLECNISMKDELPEHLIYPTLKEIQKVNKIIIKHKHFTDHWLWGGYYNDNIANSKLLSIE